MGALRWLFVFGADIDVVDTRRTTLLHAACRTGSLAIVKELVRRGLSVNAVDAAGWTPLHVAACMGRDEVTFYLLKAGASQIANGRGQVPVDLTSRHVMKEAVGKYAHVSSPVSGFPTRETASCAPVGYEMSNPSPVQFEPFFIPRDPMTHGLMHVEELRRLGVQIFNENPGQGLAFLVSIGIVRDYPVSINAFLLKQSASGTSLGEFLGERVPIAQALRLEFLNSLPLFGTGVVGALETAFMDMAVPVNLMKVDHLINGVANVWWQQHQGESWEGERLQATRRAGELVGCDLQESVLCMAALRQLMFSALMLHRCFEDGRTMSLNQWIELNTSEDGDDVPVHAQSGIYTIIKEHGLRLGKPTFDSKHVSPTKAGWIRVSFKYVPSGSDGHAALPSLGPRVLAMTGGVSTAGCSPVPPTAPGYVDPAEVPNLQSLKCLDERGELMWVSVYYGVLLLATDETVTAPFAFVPLRYKLRQVLLEPVDSRRLALSCSLDPALRLLVPGQRETLEVCLLLADGRFQPLDVQNLELSFEEDDDYESWSEQLTDLVARVSASNTLSFMGQTRPPKAMAMKKPGLPNKFGADDADVPDIDFSSETTHSL